jgi:hypothetical protein
MVINLNLCSTGLLKQNVEEVPYHAEIASLSKNSVFRHICRTEKQLLAFVMSCLSLCPSVHFSIHME